MPILILLVLLIIFFPSLRLMIKRIGLSSKIRKVCRKHCFNVIPTHKLWYLGRRTSDFCDIYIETKYEILAIKLFSVTKKNSILIFDENGSYINRKRRPITLGSFANVDSSAKRIPDYNFRYNYDSRWEIKTPKNILLINPVCNEILYRKRNGIEYILGSGDVVNGMYIYPLSRFVGLLEHINDTENI